MLWKWIDTTTITPREPPLCKVGHNYLDHFSVHDLIVQNSNPRCNHQVLHEYIPLVYIDHSQDTTCVSNNTCLCLSTESNNKNSGFGRPLLIPYKYGQMGCFRQTPCTDLHNCHSLSQMCLSKLYCYLPSIRIGNNQRLHQGQFEWILSNNAHQLKQHQVHLEGMNPKENRLSEESTCTGEEEGGGTFSVITKQE